MIKKENLLIQKYLKEHSLVESNILSFNDFIENKMQQIIDDMNKNLSNEEMEIKIGKIPIIVRSSACTTSKMSEQDLLKNYMDPKDSGGYFIINGNERVIVMS